MANTNKWKIENNSNSSSAGNELNGLLVKKTGSGYELYAVLGKYTPPPPPAPQNNPPTFNNVSWDGQSWNIVFTSLPVGNNGAGTWTLLDSATDAEPTGAEDGDFTAQASGGHPDEEADEAASSASA